jgi:hypothetical protein
MIFFTMVGKLHFTGEIIVAQGCTSKMNEMSFHAWCTRVDMEKCNV